MSDELWSTIRGCFETDDGSLPSIEVNGLSTTDVASIYSMLRKQSRLWNEDAVYWDVERQAEVPVDSVENAAALVGQGRAEPFHLCLSDLAVSDALLPDIGVFVFSDSIELDYRMGPEWTRDRVAALFELLCQIVIDRPSAVVEPSSPEGPPDPAAFRHFWSTLQSALKVRP
jgi:hypothetical protein